MSMLTTRNKLAGSNWCDLDPWRLEKRDRKRGKRAGFLGGPPKKSLACETREISLTVHWRSRNFSPEIATRPGELRSVTTRRKIECLALQAFSTSTSSITNRNIQIHQCYPSHRQENARSGTISISS